jgi:copper(I)-binding protein
MSSAVRSTLAAAVGLTAVMLSPAIAQEYKAGSIRIEAPWLRAAPAGAQTAAGYLKVENAGKEADRLIGGSVPFAAKLQVHEMSMAGGVMKMRELPKGLEVNPGTTVELKPGSYHLMFEDLKQPLREGDKIKGTLVFEKAGTVEVEYVVRGMAAKTGSGAGAGTGQMGGQAGGQMGHGHTMH